MKSLRQPSLATTSRRGDHLDLSGARAIVKARRFPASGSVEDLPPLNLAIYASFTNEAWDYLEKQLGEFELTLAMYHDTPCQPIQRTADEDQSGVKK